MKCGEDLDGVVHGEDICGEAICSGRISTYAVRNDTPLTCIRCAAICVPQPSVAYNRRRGTA